MSRPNVADWQYLGIGKFTLGLEWNCGRKARNLGHICEDTFAYGSYSSKDDFARYTNYRYCNLPDVQISCQHKKIVRFEWEWINLVLTVQLTVIQSFVIDTGFQSSEIRNGIASNWWTTSGINHHCKYRSSMQSKYSESILQTSTWWLRCYSWTPGLDTTLGMVQLWSF